MARLSADLNIDEILQMVADDPIKMHIVNQI